MTTTNENLSRASSTKPLKEFIDYCWEFYKPKGLYGEYFDRNLTKEEVKAACLLRSKHPTFEGDSVDREAVRDTILFARGKLTIAGRI